MRRRYHQPDAIGPTAVVIVVFAVGLSLVAVVAAKQPPRQRDESFCQCCGQPLPTVQPKPARAKRQEPAPEPEPEPEVKAEVETEPAQPAPPSKRTGTDAFDIIMPFIF